MSSPCFPTAGPWPGPPFPPPGPRGTSSSASAVLRRAPTPAAPSRRTPGLARRYPRCVGTFAPPRHRRGPEGQEFWVRQLRQPKGVEGGRQVSPVPGEPWRVFALVSDPGRTGAPGPYGAPTRPLRSFRRWAHCDKLDFGAPEHGLHTRCLRFVTSVARSDARLTSGCWPGSTRWDWLPTGFPRKVSELQLFPLSQALPDARTTQLTCRGRPSKQ